MKLGDKIECVVAEDCHLTVGKRYEVVEFGDPIFVTVVNDDGETRQYFRERFRETGGRG